MLVSKLKSLGERDEGRERGEEGGTTNTFEVSRRLPF